jgi:TPR repeat protein
MRISEHILSVALFGFGLGLTTAHAFDSTKSPANVFPPVGGGVAVAPQGAPSTGVGAGHLDAFQAFQTGAQALRAGDTKAALDALEYAARNGEVTALWKLGRMYADGDGVKQNDLRAFDYFRTLADSHADETPGTRPAVFVAKAFVAIGGYYLTGIPNSDVKPDAVHAREMFWYAASYFGDPDAQYRLGRMYLDGQGIAKDPKQARRWLFTAAGKGQYEAQAVLGAMLFRGQSVARDAARGLMWLILARDAATSKETWITDLYNAAVKQATEVERNVALVHVEQWIEQSRGGQRTP